MTYVSSGNVVAKRSPWRLSIITDAFWSAVNFVGLFASSLFSTPSRSTQSRSSSSSTQSSNRRNGPRRPMGGIDHRGTINQPMGGG